MEAAEKSYRLRLRQALQAKEKLAIATRELDELFERIFKNPDAAKAKFTSLVESRGLAYACRKMNSKPARVVPGWKALRGKHDAFIGPSREREHARELLTELGTFYRAAEEAHRAHAVAQGLVESGLEALQQAQAEQPMLEQAQQGQRQKRKLRQRL